MQSAIQRIQIDGVFLNIEFAAAQVALPKRDGQQASISRDGEAIFAIMTIDKRNDLRYTFRMY